MTVRSDTYRAERKRCKGCERKCNTRQEEMMSNSCCNNAPASDVMNLQAFARLGRC
jgi:hypothetical protein